jgi:AsmA protein
MKRKRILIIAGAVLALLILIVVSLPFLISANDFRPTLEQRASQALGRKVQVGNLAFSLFSGSLRADNLSIADDPRFSQSPFLVASSLKVGVEMWPLIFSRQLNITDITIDKPVVHLIANSANQWNYSTLASTGNPAPSQPQAKQNNLTIGSLDVTNGEVTLTPAGVTTPSIYNNVQMQTTNFSLASAFPVALSMSLPGGGSLKLDGTVGPVNSTDATLTPLEADVHVDSFDIAKSGLVEPASGLSGLVDLTNHLSSVNGKEHLKGVVTLRKLKLVPNGAPSGVPITMDFDLDYALAQSAGTLNSGLLHVGRAQANVKGTFASKGTVTSVDLTTAGQGMPVDDLTAALPAFGVVLPAGSSLHGGTMSINVHSQGPISALVAAGNVGVYGTRLAGFDLGSKLSTVSKITGVHVPSGNDTEIQRLTGDIRYSPAGSQVSNLVLVIAGLGQVTGAGTLSAGNALNFHMVAQLASGGGGVLGETVGKTVSMAKIPFAVQGTASDPKVIPDVGGAVGSMATGIAGTLGGTAAGAAGAPAQQLGKSLGGLLGKKN